MDSRQAQPLNLSYLLEFEIGFSRDNTQEFVSGIIGQWQTMQLLPDPNALGRRVYERDLTRQRL